MKTIDFDKQHLRNCLRTLKQYEKISIEEDLANSLGYTYYNKYVGKLVAYSFKSYPDWALCKLTLTLKYMRSERQIEIDIPYDSRVHFGDITKKESYTIDYIDSGPHQYYTFTKIK